MPAFSWASPEPSPGPAAWTEWVRLLIGLNIRPYNEYSESIISMTLTPATCTTTSNATVQVHNFHSHLPRP
jgi:hypothetical protein